MNIKEFLDIVNESVPSIELSLGRSLTHEEKSNMVKGAIAKWNLSNPDNWLVIPEEYKINGQ